jgi:alkylation response protein AidB-like acyl-CoA dehydrogenase
VGGWRLDDVTMTAEPIDGGWMLDGSKVGVMAPDDVDEIAVVARVGDGFGVFVVPAADAVVTPMQSLDASRPLSSVHLDRVVVPGERALGDPGGDASLEGIRRALEEATLALALETVGAVDALFQLVLAYVKERQQFGVVVGSFQAMKHKMSNMYISLERARALCYYAVAAIEEDGERRAVAVAMAKAASDECQHLVCGESIQSFGGIGFTWEHDCQLFVKRAATNAALFGRSADHSLTVAASIGVTSR